MFDCLDCEVDTSELGEYYMVWDILWMEAVGDLHGGMLCLGCLEKRLGITLTPDDFTDAPVNQGWGNVSERMKDRTGL